MKKPSVSRNYQRLSDANLNTRAGTIVESLTDNVNFPLTSPTLPVFAAAAELYDKRLKASISSRSRADIILKNNAREALLDQLRLLAVNVESLAEGDLFKLTTSGFILTSQGGHASPLEVPTNFRLRPGKNPGELVLSIKRVTNATSYIFEYTIGPITEDSKWISRGSSSKEYTFTNLPRGTEVFCRVAAIGSRGQEIYSAILSTIVL
jgi:hypothetical protein